MKSQNETFAKLSQLEARLNALDTEADQARQNQQSIDGLNQELQQFKTEIDNTLKSHQNALATLDEDVMRLKEKVEPPLKRLRHRLPLQMSQAPRLDLHRENCPRKVRMKRLQRSTEAEDDDSDEESMQFVEWMENFFSAIWNWFAGLFS